MLKDTEDETELKRIQELSITLNPLKPITDTNSNNKNNPQERNKKMTKGL